MATNTFPVAVQALLYSTAVKLSEIGLCLISKKEKIRKFDEGSVNIVDAYKMDIGKLLSS